MALKGESTGDEAQNNCDVQRGIVHLEQKDLDEIKASEHKHRRETWQNRVI